MSHPFEGEPKPVEDSSVADVASSSQDDFSASQDSSDQQSRSESVTAGTADDAQPAQSGQSAAPRTREKPRRKKKKSKYGWLEVPILGAVAILVAVLVKSFLIQPFYIPSESMEKTLHGCYGCSGDRILVNKPIYHLRDPHPGDIVVFRAPSDWEQEAPISVPSNPVSKVFRGFGQLVGFVPPDEKDIVKRVIAIGGETVRCCDAEGRVQISEHGNAGPWRSLDEPYIFEPLKFVPESKPGAPAGDDKATFGPVTVPAGRLWVMGDHRSVSADSRYHCVNESPVDRICNATNVTIPISSVIGKAVVIAWPPSRWTTLGTPDTFTHTATTALSAAAPASGLVATLPLLMLRRRQKHRSQKRRSQQRSSQRRRQASDD
jgi:signal peptidase I